jgi:hypothetical protein
VGVGLGPLITTLVKVVGVKLRLIGSPSFAPNIEAPFKTIGEFTVTENGGLGSPDVRVYLKIRLFPLFCLES